MEKLFDAEALDVFYTPIYMKKNRPAVKLEVICKEEKLDNIREIIFKETSTIGVREFKVYRTIMEREINQIDTKYGKIDVKKSIYNDIEKYSPEYEDCKRIAIQNEISIKSVYEEVIRMLN